MDPWADGTRDNSCIDVDHVLVEAAWAWAEMEQASNEQGQTVRNGTWEIAKCMEVKEAIGLVVDGWSLQIEVPHFEE